MTATASAPLAPSSKPQATNRWLVLVIACLAQFMVVLDATVVNVALPSIQRGLHFSASNLQWVVNAYTLVFGGFLLLGGRAADLLGRKRLFVAGVVAVLGRVAAQRPRPDLRRCWSPAAALQGLGAALALPRRALAIITTTFTDSSERTKALGVWSAIAAGGGAVGLLLGGVLTDLASWRVDLHRQRPGRRDRRWLLTLRYVPESRDELPHRSFDLAGAVSVTAGLIVLVYAIVKAQSFGWGSGRTIGLLAAAAALLARSW